MYLPRERVVVDEVSLKQTLDFSDNLFSQLDRSLKYVLSFSTGKDSVMMLDRAIKNNLKTAVYSQVIIEGLSYNQEVYDYYEERGVVITRIESGITTKLQVSDLLCINKIFDMRYYNELPLKAGEKFIYELEHFDFNLIGIKQNDSPTRRLMLNQAGWKQPKSRKAYPIYNVSDRLTWAYIYKNNLPVNRCYEWFGRSQDVMNYKHLFPLKEKSPKDFDLFVYNFPLIEAMCWIKAERISSTNGEMIFSQLAKRGNRENYNVSLDNFLCLCFDSSEEKEYYAKKYLSEWVDEYVVYLEGKNFILTPEQNKFKAQTKEEFNEATKDLSANDKWKRRKSINNNIDHFINLYYESNEQKRLFLSSYGINPDVNCVDGMKWKIY